MNINEVIDHIDGMFTSTNGVSVTSVRITLGMWIVIKRLLNDAQAK